MGHRLIFLLGPTAIGKTETSLELAKFANCEIISCDSMQVYKGMDIGTSKPPKAMLEAVPHHLIDITEPSQEFSVAQYRRLAIKAIEDIISKGRIPLFVGGSGLYFKVLVDGIFEGPASDRELRARLTEEADEFGAKVLYEKLKKIDREAASKIHANDLRRIIRALEVYEKTKTPISKLKEKTEGLAGNYDIRVFGLNIDRGVLYRKIDERVDLMLGQGLIDEARKLMEQNLSLTASQALGYKEAFGFIRGEYDFNETERLLKRNTRRYAKRQLTWFRRDKRIEWIILDEDFNSKEIANRIWKKLS